MIDEKGVVLQPYKRSVIESFAKVYVLHLHEDEHTVSLNLSKIRSVAYMRTRYCPSRRAAGMCSLHASTGRLLHAITDNHWGI